MPEKFQRAPTRELQKVKGVCFDIDDTFSSEGKILPETFSALWDLKKSGFPLVPITGRPAGWCDHIARFWPVDAVVGENGAFVFSMKCGKLVRFDTELSDPAKRKARLEGLKRKILKTFQVARFASDQNFREFDLAIDVREDVKPWKELEVVKLIKFCESEGAHVKLSSIHVNTWFGSYDKLSGFKNWLKKSGSKVPIDSWMFLGDSPNDEPLFKAFSLSVGVANVKKYWGQMTFKPRWITAQKSGLGFVEVARRLTEIK